MKIRQKLDHNCIVEIPDGTNKAHLCWYRDGHGWWFWDENLMYYSVYDNVDWEEVPPEPEMVNVTSDWKTYRGRSGLSAEDQPIFALKHGCEWRKIEAYVGRLEDNGMSVYEPQTVLQIWGPQS